MAVISGIFAVILIFAVGGALVWLIKFFSELAYGKSGQHAPTDPDKNLNLAMHMVQQQNRQNKKNRNNVLPTSEDEKGKQYTYGGVIYNTKHYRTSHFTDDLTNNKRSYRTNNHTYGSTNFGKGDNRSQDNRNIGRNRQGKQNGNQNTSQKNKCRKMFDSLADSYAKSMKYTEGYEQALKRSKKE